MKKIERIILPREAKISQTTTVRRVLPFRERRMVGPFCFLDHMGPEVLHANGESDVFSHPHIGISTVTYLFEGQLLHLDSVGSQQLIVPGDVNWMTAGKGVVHAEKVVPESLREHPRLHGLQAWVALPIEREEVEPSFQHVSRGSLPTWSQEGVTLSIIAGTIGHLKSPVATSSPLFYGKLEFRAGGKFATDFGDQEVGFYLIDGSVLVDGEVVDTPSLIVFRRGESFEVEGIGNALGVVFGGMPFLEPRYMLWNFVSSRKDRLDLAKADWQTGNFKGILSEARRVPFPS